jgi:hypothetical protein
LHPQPVKVHGCSVRFICVGPRLDEFLFEVFVDRSVRSRRSRDGQNPVLCTPFPFIDVWAAHVREGVGNFLPWIHHYWVRSVYELIEAKFVEEVIGCLSVSFEDWRFFPLEGFIILSDRVWLLQ